MSNPTTINPPAQAGSTSSAPHVQAEPRLTVTLEWLRAEWGAQGDSSRTARLLAHIGELEERSGEAAAAARDFLEAYDADPTFREPIESLLRVLQRRPTLKSQPRIFDTLVESAASPQERVRALVLRATQRADVDGDWGAAQADLLEAVAVEGAPAADRAHAWLLLEIAAGITGDASVRQRALSERAEFAADPTWRALLLIDRARIAATAGELESCVTLLEQARAGESQASWAVSTVLEAVVREYPSVIGTGEARTRAERHAGSLDSVATLIQTAILDGTRGDLLGVPAWVRQPDRAVEGWLRAAEGWRRLGQADQAGAALNRALSLLDRMDGLDRRLAEALVSRTWIRIAEQTGDTALAAHLAQGRLAANPDGPAAAALALRIAEHEASQGNAAAALEALNKAVTSDPGCLPAWALKLDLLADGGDAGGFAAELEAFAEHLSTDEARSRSFLLAAYTWATRARDVTAAKAALTQAAIFGAAPETTGRLARVLASLQPDWAWYEEATRRLIASRAGDGLWLGVELVRLRDARGDADGAARALRDVRESPGGGWFARVIEAFSQAPQSERTRGPANESRWRAAVEELAADEPEPGWASALRAIAALRAHKGHDLEAARQWLRQLTEGDPDDVSMAAYLADLDRAAGDPQAAARIASATAQATSDTELAAALHLEAALMTWRSGQQQAAVEEMRAAVSLAPQAGGALLRWALWGVDAPSARTQALSESDGHHDEAAPLALEQFAADMAGGDPEAATAALDRVERSANETLQLAASLARLTYPARRVPSPALWQAIDRVAKLGRRAALLAAGERVRVARESGDAEAMVGTAREWLEAGAGLPGALEWLAAAMALGDAREETDARLAIAGLLPPSAREALVASAALLQTRIDVDRPAPLLEGSSPAARLANLELAPPGCDPRRRAAALEELGRALGDDARTDALGLAGWAHFAAQRFDQARSAFEAVVLSRPGDLAAWEGLRSCGENSGDGTLRARAAAELGARCKDDARGAAFWEEAALTWLELDDASNGEQALQASFARDASRAVAFDKLFRRLRDRKDSTALLTVIARRLEVTSDAAEIQRLYWEQARALREIGDPEAALKALEHVTMLEPDHVGALALLGEINIRRGHFEAAATALAHLAMLDNAPPKSRVTAGVAAVDIYENKLNLFDKSLDVLTSLHLAKISTLPVRERLARAAARTGAWRDATAILQELMTERPTTAGRAEAARLAMAIHRDRLGNAQGGADAVVRLLEENPTDPEGLLTLRQTNHPFAVRLRLLESAREMLVGALQRRANDATSVRLLASVAADLSDEGLQHAALSVLSAIGASDAQAEQTLAQLAAKKRRTPQVTLSDDLLLALLAPGDEAPLADFFALLGPTLAEALGPTLQACGVGRRDRVDPRSGLSLRIEIASWAGAFGIGEFELYIGGTDPLGIQGVGGEIPSLVVGPGLKAPLAPLTRARVARELLGLVRGTTITRSRDEVTLAAIVAAGCRLADVALEHPPYPMLAEMERHIGKALGRRTRKALPEVCSAIAARSPDVLKWSKRAIASLDRAAVVASGDPGVVLSEVLSVPIDRVSGAVVGNKRADELLAFVLSPGYLAVRAALGLEGGA
jgi:hypothetical protein